MKSIELWQQAVLQHSPRCRNWKAALELHRSNLLSLWQVYTQERRKLGRLPITDARLVGPYLLGFHLPNVARFQGLLGRGFQRGLALPERKGPVRVIDLGAGTGAGSIAVYETLKKLVPENELEFELIDRSRHLVQCASGLLQKLAPKAKVRALSKALNDEQTDHLFAKWYHLTSRLNILCLGYVWNELSAHPRLRGHLLETLHVWSQCESPTWLAVTEPAAEASARNAMKLRQSLIEMDWQVIYPCLQTDSCPMGTDGRDWCYSEMDFKKPAPQIEVEKMLGVSRATLGSAAYLFVNEAAIKAKSALNSKANTVVGRPKKTDGKTDLLLCDGSRLHKISSPAFVKRGDLWP